MKPLTLLIATLLSTSLFSQENAMIPAADFKKLRFGVNFSPDYCFRTLRNNDGSNSSSLVIRVRDTNEKGKIGYTGGFNVSYHFRENLAIETGIQFSNKGYQVDLGELTYGDPIDPRRGPVNYAPPGNPPISGRITYSHYYLDIPLRMIFIPGQRKMRFIASAGVVTNIFIQGKESVDWEFDDGTHDKNISPIIPHNKDINLSPLVSLGVDWKLTGRSNLRVEPTLRYGVLKMTDTPVSENLYTAGLNLGYYRSF